MTPTPDLSDARLTFALPPLPPRAHEPEPDDALPGHIATVYAEAAAPLRAQLLQSLLQTVGPLGLVAVSAGAFGRFLHCCGSTGAVQVHPEDTQCISAHQVLELARYVQQSRPDLVERLAGQSI